MPFSPEIHSQYDALTTSAGLVDLPDRTLIELTGADRAQFLHSFCTNDVKKLAAGQGCEAFVTNPQGKTLGHGYVFHLGDRLLMDTVAGQAAMLIPHFEKYVISEDVTFRELTSTQADLLLAGPQAAQILGQLTAIDPPAAAPGCVVAQIAGNPVVVKRLEYVGPQSFFLQASRDAIPTITAAILNAGAVKCSTEAAEICRLEHGTPLFGQDITDDNLPQEIGRTAQAISFTKGCYLGQETVARIDALGHVNRLLCGVKIDGPVPPRGTPLSLDGKEVGQITSAVDSPKLQAVLALALVRRAQTKPGTRLRCGDRGCRNSSARVICGYRPENSP